MYKHLRFISLIKLCTACRKERCQHNTDQQRMSHETLSHEFKLLHEAKCFHTDVLSTDLLFKRGEKAVFVVMGIGRYSVLSYGCQT